ncbi:hypothetical protein HX792_14320 [Pseudomonas sp. B6002]|uniref:hypothetical protein n=1 Tax=Pseudomonas sp. B6002 TaxID=2726978 RepID=UPI0015A17B8F|nr:hypothetical protein [Pseudomonas sp. B6002]NVZ51517.1 hypothetical protein [Pseudomonas sp. B6002]
MNIINLFQQYIVISPEDIFSFDADDQFYQHAQLVSVHQGAALIKTQHGDQEAISVNSMRLVIRLIPESSSLLRNSPPVKKKPHTATSLGFPLDGLGIRSYSSQGASYAEPLFQGVVPVSNYTEPQYQGVVPNVQYPASAPPGTSSPVSSVIVATINVPVYVEIVTHQDGSQNINIYDQASYPSIGSVPSSPTQGVDMAFFLAEEERREKERLAFIMDYS